MWQKLYEGCEILESPTEGFKFVPRPTEEFLINFEQTHTVKLPLTYKKFAQTFGAGELAGLYRIATPMSAYCDFELNMFNKTYHDQAGWILLEYASQETISKFFFFCEGGGEDFFGWNTSEITESANNEYAIYMFRDDITLKKVADSFSAFIFEYVLKPDSDRGWKPENRFSPFQIEV